MLAASIYDILLAPMPITNPGYIGANSPPLFIVDTSLSPTNFYFSVSATKQLWYFIFNFNKHPLCAIEGNYVTGVSYVNLTGPDNQMVAVTNSQYNGFLGVTITGGTLNQTYELVVGATLNNSQVITAILGIGPRP